MPGSNARASSCLAWCHTNTIIPEPANAANWNRYAYTNYNPIRYSDPSGHRIEEGTGGWAGGGGGSGTEGDIGILVDKIDPCNPFFASNEAQILLENLLNGYSNFWDDFNTLTNRIIAPSIILRDIYDYYDIDLLKVAIRGEQNPLTREMITEYIDQSEKYGPFHHLFDIENLLTAQRTSYLLQKFVSIYTEENGLESQSTDEFTMMFEPNYLATVIRHNENQYYAALNEYPIHGPAHEAADWTIDLSKEFFSGDE